MQWMHFLRNTRAKPVDVTFRYVVKFYGLLFVSVSTAFVTLNYLPISTIEFFIDWNPFMNIAKF